MDTRSRFFSQITKPSACFGQMASRGTYACGPTYPYDSSFRTDFSDIKVRIYGRPSRGGVIALDTTEAINFEFLGLNPLEPPLRRLDNQAAENAFCQRLLLFGAKWWDSEARYSIMSNLEAVAAAESRVDCAFDVDKQPHPQCARSTLSRSGGRRRGDSRSPSSIRRGWA